MEYEGLVHSQVFADPYNPRKTFKQGLLEELAGSIAEYGLLENLVVRPSTDGEKFWLVAGERRWRAIRILIESGRWRDDQPINCLIISESDGKMESLVENLHRVDISPWELGFRFSELLESGYTQSEIGRKLGDRSPSYVGRHVQLAKGLHPETIKRLNRLSSKVPLLQLGKLASYKDADGYPDAKAQREYLERLIGQRRVKGKRKRAPATDTKRMVRRLQHLRDEMKVPRHAQPFVDTIIAYLCGQTRSPVFPEEL